MSSYQYGVPMKVFLLAFAVLHFAETPKSAEKANKRNLFTLQYSRRLLCLSNLY